MIDHINNWLAQVKNNYGVNPLIFAVIYCTGIIPFWFSVYKITDGLRRKNFKQVKIFAVVLAIVIIAPFTYVAVWGHNLPFWVWLIAAALIAYSTYSIFRKLKVSRR
ncbi:MAG: hypothetical protein WBB37_06245 [bacterium]